MNYHYGTTYIIVIKIFLNYTLLCCIAYIYKAHMIF
jgi:hypothetical protein